MATGAAGTSETASAAIAEVAARIKAAAAKTAVFIGSTLRFNGAIDSLLAAKCCNSAATTETSCGLQLGARWRATRLFSGLPHRPRKSGSISEKHGGSIQNGKVSQRYRASGPSWPMDFTLATGCPAGYGLACCIDRCRAAAGVALPSRRARPLPFGLPRAQQKGGYRNHRRWTCPSWR